MDTSRPSAMFPSAIGKKVCNNKQAEQAALVKRREEIARLEASLPMPKRQPRPIYCWPPEDDKEQPPSKTAPQTHPPQKPILGASLPVVYQPPLASSPPPLPRPTISYPTVQQTLRPNIETSFSTPRPAPLPPFNHAPFNLPQKSYLAPVF